jgi:hypothetical protein
MRSCARSQSSDLIRGSRGWKTCLMCAWLHLGQALIEQYCSSFRKAPKAHRARYRRYSRRGGRLFDRLHGGQQFRPFNALHGDCGFQPIVVFDDRGL